jgi:large conductance mechanosensitive channel
MKKLKFKDLAKEFSDFALKGAAFGTAIGIMLGGVLKDLITSLIDNILMPPIAYITSGIDFSDLFFVIGKGKYESIEQAKEAGKLIVTYGNFINSLVIFLITTLVLFFLTNILLKSVKRALIKEEKEEKAARKCPYCFSEVNEKATRCPHCTSKL